MKHDPWETWSTALRLLNSDESWSQAGGLASLRMQTQYNKKVRRPTAEVLRLTLDGWEKQEPAPDGDVKAEAQRLLASLDRRRDPRRWLGVLGLRGKTPC